MQLPFVADDRWLGLEFPPDQKLDTDRLLYTAHFAAPFDKTAPQCGLLLDEWTETIPAPTRRHRHRLPPRPAQLRGAAGDAARHAVRVPRRVAVGRPRRRAQRDPRPGQAPRGRAPSTSTRRRYAPFLPATVMATQVHQLTIAADLALNNKIAVGGGLTWRNLKFITENLAAVISASKSKPGITIWNRLEGRPARRQVRPRAAGRGARPALDAHPPVADRRVQDRSC